MKKSISIITVLFLVVGLCACNTAQGEDTTVPVQTMPSGYTSLKPLAVETLEGDPSGGFGYIIIYEDEERIVFYGRAGLFAYDLVEREMIFTVDFMKAYGTPGSVQGETGTYAAASPDGMEIVIYYTEPQRTFDAYYIDVASMSYRTGEFRDLDPVFDRYSLVEGELEPEPQLEDTVYERDGETWAVFAEYTE